MKRLLALGPCGSSKKLMNTSSISPPFCNNSVPSYSTEKDEGTFGAIGEKARSTAEEFLRVAKEKADQVSERARETSEEMKEAVIGESEDEKEKLKERVEKGKSYENADRD